jgi:uncharacterized protein YndB with AHSA1/START domain
MMQVIHHVFDVAAPPARVYPALATADGLAGWWSTRVTADLRVGGLISFIFAADFHPRMRIATLSEPHRVEWEMAGGHEPWNGSTFRFDLAEAPAGTRVRFWQGYGRQLGEDAFGVYNFNWGYYLDSLRLYAETGTGKPFRS